MTTHYMTPYGLACRQPFEGAPRVVGCWDAVDCQACLNAPWPAGPRPEELPD